MQVTGVGDFTKINIKAGDAGGEIDNRGADGRGNPSTSSNTLVAIINIFQQLVDWSLGMASERVYNIMNGRPSFQTRNSASVRALDPAQLSFATISMILWAVIGCGYIIQSSR